MPWRLDPGNDLMLNMHLKPSGKPEITSAQVGLYFTDHPPSKQPMLLQLEHDSALDIPAGKRNFLVEDGLRPSGRCSKCWGFIRTRITWASAGGVGYTARSTEEMADPDSQWDIDRQSVYRYREPVFLPKGSVVHMRYTSTTTLRTTSTIPIIHLCV